MLTPENELKGSKETMEGNISLAEDILRKAEKYERLKGNPDWEGVLEDIKVLMGIHDKEISNALAQLTSVRPSGTMAEDNKVYGRDDWFDFILMHQIRKEQLQEALNEQKRILEAAKMAREALPKLKDKLEKIDLQLANA